MNDRPFECDVCEARKREKADLVKHMRVHLGERKCACAICGEKCNHHQALALHTRSHGKGSKVHS
eukprot:TRINITY_DN10619_c0_g1_i1.p1 TRINITY_DN10619_c0_g1~~TRINITY_DN10619_c0_g1_i1.p1  ORF type:complete len:65 (+),score=8.13 TRINITY_DN10619_c0_g1_i1:324-518(+)